MSRTAVAPDSSATAWDRAAGDGPGIGRLSLVLMGWRMSAATRDGRRRLALAGVGAALAMLVLLLGMAAMPVNTAQQDRADARRPLDTGVTHGDGLDVTAEQTSSSGMPSWFRGIEVDTITAVPVGTPKPPPGLDTFPAAGTIAASPEFARLHAQDPLFAARYPGTISAIIRPEGLRGPNEVFAWISVPHAEGTYFAAGYGTPPQELAGETTDDTNLIVPLGVLLFVLPIMILLGTSTRLGSAQRDQRMAAMRLVGATPGEVRLVSAAEAGLIGVVGVVGGLVLFTAVRPMATLLPWRPGVFPSDLAAPPAVVASVAVGLPMLGIVAGYLSQRRVVTSPLGVTRRAVPRSPGLRRLGPLLLGLALLVSMLFNPDLLDTSGDAALASVLLLGGAGLTILGLVLATPLVGALTATAVVRLRRLPVAAQLGARRVQSDPRAASRVVTGTAVLAFVATWLLASFLPVLDQAQTGWLTQQASQIDPGTVTGTGRINASADLAAIPGVRGVVPVLIAEKRKGEGAVAIADCSLLSTALRQPLPRCAPHSAYTIWAEPKKRHLQITDQVSDRRRELSVASFDKDGMPAGDTQGLTDALYGLVQANYLLPATGNTPADLPDDWGVRFVVTTDGSSDAIETVKTVLAASTGWVPRTMDEERLLSTQDRQTYQLLAFGYLLALGLVAAVSLAVTMADDLRTRRRSLASLAAAGTPASTLRRAGLVQLLLTLVPATLLSLGAATVAAWTYSTLADFGDTTPRPFDPSVIGLVGVGSLLIVLAAYALTLPTLRSTVDVRGLRTG